MFKYLRIADKIVIQKFNVLTNLSLILCNFAFFFSK